MSVFRNNENSLLQKIQSREPIIHLFFWAIYLLIPFLKSITRGNHYYHFSSELNDLFFGLIVFYVTYLFFLPSKNKIRNGIGLILFFGIIGYFNFKIHNLLFQGSHKELYWYYAFGYISTYSIISLFAYVIYSIKEAYKNQVALDEAIQQKQHAELAALKARLNPHFLFNTLNTIYASSLKKEDKTSELILKLSDSFRYVLQEGQNEQVIIRQEINHLKDYISLQKERLSDKVIVETLLDIDNFEQEVPPLLLISFVENAFKYTSLLRGFGHPINIRICLHGKTFKFYCDNPFGKNVKKEMNRDWKKSGIGITNTKKRLQHLFPNKYDLKIAEESSLSDESMAIYKVELLIHL